MSPIVEVLFLALAVGAVSGYFVMVFETGDPYKIEPRLSFLNRVISYEVSYDDGRTESVMVVWSVFDVIRNFFGAYTTSYHTDREGRYIYTAGVTYDLWTCPVCLSFWVAGVLTTLCSAFVYHFSLPMFLVVWLTAAAVSAFATRG
jgi:hypothetical protein